jgi:hypothetical protein
VAAKIRSGQSQLPLPGFHLPQDGIRLGKPAVGCFEVVRFEPVLLHDDHQQPDALVGDRPDSGLLARVCRSRP